MKKIFLILAMFLIAAVMPAIGDPNAGTPSNEGKAQQSSPAGQNDSSKVKAKSDKLKKTSKKTEQPWVNYGVLLLGGLIVGIVIPPSFRSLKRHRAAKKGRGREKFIKLIKLNSEEAEKLDSALISHFTAFSKSAGEQREKSQSKGKKASQKKPLANSGKQEDVPMKASTKILVQKLNCKKNEEVAFATFFLENYYDQYWPEEEGKAHQKKYQPSDVEATQLSDAEVIGRFQKVAIKKENDGHVIYLLVLKCEQDETTETESYKQGLFKRIHYVPLPLWEKGGNEASDTPLLEKTMVPVDEITAKIDETLKNDILNSQVAVVETTSIYKDEESSTKNNFADELKELLNKLFDARQTEKENLQSLIKNLQSDAGKSGGKLQTELRQTREKLRDAEKQLNKLREKIKKDEKTVSDAACAKKDAEDTIRIARDKVSKAKNELEAEKKAHSATQELLNAEKNTTAKLRSDMQAYTSQLVIRHDLQPLAKDCMSLLATYNELLQFSEQMAGASRKDLDHDDYNYYYARIVQKFTAACAPVSSDELNAFTIELTMLAQNGMMPANGVVQNSIQGSKNAENTLRVQLYSKLFKHLVGAAIVMSDEFAYLLPNMVKDGCPDVKKAGKITNALLAAAQKLGFDVVYATPFTKVKGNVEIIGFTPADIPSNTIFEVKHMAVNFGTAKEETTVVSKE